MNQGPKSPTMDYQYSTLQVDQQRLPQETINGLIDNVPHRFFNYRCRSSHADDTFRLPAPVLSFRYSSVHFFQTRINVDLFRCKRAPIA
ncbi:hypothetical protein TNCV_1608441 [Trichonephila clavipes]|nr:hypothetical protein TNCV_1608441 [Trichonephila clavipes]